MKIENLSHSDCAMCSPRDEQIVDKINELIDAVNEFDRNLEEICGAIVRLEVATKTISFKNNSHYLKEEKPSETELLPCPFCGSKAENTRCIMNTYYITGCSNKDCICFYFNARKELAHDISVKKWNIRV